MKSLYLDFDGVLIDSNQVKSSAFQELGEIVVSGGGEILSDIHVHNPGLSRFSIFEQVISHPLFDGKTTVKALLDEYERLVLAKLLACERSSYISLLRQSKVRASVVSAAPEDELRRLIIEFGWQEVFEGRVWGAPKTKRDILAEVHSSGSQEIQGIYIGDSSSDYYLAQEFGFDFVFISGWSHWKPKLEESESFAQKWDTLDEFLVMSDLI